MYRRLLSCLFLLLAAACSPFDTATPTPIPTVIPTITPTSEPTVSPIEIPTALPSEAPMLAATEIPSPAATEIPTEAPPPVTASTTVPANDTPIGTAASLTPQASATRQAAATPASPEPTVRPATQQQVDKIEQQTADIRGLNPKAKVPDHFISQQQMQASLTVQIKADYTAAQAKLDAHDLWYLRLIDSPSLNLLQLQLDLLGEQVIGYYDTDKKDLFVLDTKQPLDPEAVDTLSHEYTHSLQDQYFDLNKMQPKNSHNSDRGTAITSLIEGDAVLEQTLYAEQYMSPADLLALAAASASHPSPVLDNAPAYIREGLLFPYDQGEQFVLTLYKQGGYHAVNKAFADPPTTSEQILHPEKYLAVPRDTALPVSLPPLTSTLGAGWTLQAGNTLGEFDLGVLLRTNGVNRPAATDGWGGARYATYANGASTVMLMESRWDTPTDADEFETALRDSFSNAGASGGLWTSKGRTFGIERSAAGAVVYVAGSDASLVKKALAAAK